MKKLVKREFEKTVEAYIPNKKCKCNQACKKTSSAARIGIASSAAGSFAKASVSA